MKARVLKGRRKNAFTLIEINVTKNDYYTSKRHVILIRSGETSTRSINDLMTIQALNSVLLL